MIAVDDGTEPPKRHENKKDTLCGIRTLRSKYPLQQESTLALSNIFGCLFKAVSTANNLM